MKPTIRRLATRLAGVALLVGIVGVFGSGGPPPASAQTDTTAPSISSIARIGCCAWRRICWKKQLGV